MTREEATYAARRQFGGIGQVRLERRENRGFWQVETFLQDVRHAAKTLLKAPGFTATALATLALGIGANVAVFSVVNTVLLKPLRAPDADRIVRFLNINPYGPSPIAVLPQFNMWRRQTTAFQDVSAHRIDLVNLTGGAYPEQIPLARVTAGFFQLFGAPVLHGRIFRLEEDRPNGGHVAILSHGLWTRRFASDPQVLGKPVVLGNDTYVVIGVLSPGFDTEQFDPRPDAWVPFQIDPGANEKGSYCTVTGRLKNGVTLGVANAELQSLAEEYRGMLTSPDPKASFAVQPLRDAMAGGVRASLTLLAGAVFLVLLIACANVASLLLARATARRREIAIRSAVGAGRGRIIRQLLTESAVLSLAGGALGLLLGIAGIHALLALYPANLPLPTPGSAINIPRVGEAGAAVTLDWRVLTFTVLLSLVTAILFGLVPALRAFHTSRTGFLQNRIRSLLVIGEIALALVLLVGAGLFIRTDIALHSVDPGFQSHGVLTMQMSVTGTRFEKTSDLDGLVRDSVQRVRSLPGVAAASSAC